MKILLMNDDPMEAQTSVSILVNGLLEAYRALGHSLHILTTHRVSRNPSVVCTRETTSIPISYNLAWRSYLSLWNPAVTREVAKVCEDFRPNIVHAHNIHTYLTYASLAVARRFTPSVYVSLHDVMSFAYGRLKTSTFLESHGQQCAVSIADHIRLAGRRWNPLRNVFIRRMFRTSVRRLLPVSRALEIALHQNGIGNTLVLHNAIDVDQWGECQGGVEAFVDRHNLHGKKVILFGGRLSEDKGIHALVAAMDVVRHAVPESLLLVVGDEERFAQLVKENHNIERLLPHMRCTGWLNGDAMKRAYHASHLVTTPSLCLDTFNMMNLEAQAVGLPVVGTCFGGTKEVVVHGETGFICDPRDTQTFARYIIDLLANDDLRRTFGENGRRRARQLFDIRLYLNRLEALYSENEQS